jgi:putative flippase GtrA
LPKLTRYISVGAICALAHNIIVIATTLAGLHYIAALVLSFAITTAMGYILHSLHTFSARMSWTPWIKFAAGSMTGFGLSLAMMTVLCTGLGIIPAIAAPISTLVLFAYNYVAAHWAIERGTRYKS